MSQLLEKVQKESKSITVTLLVIGISSLGTFTYKMVDKLFVVVENNTKVIERNNLIIENSNKIILDKLSNIKDKVEDNGNKIDKLIDRHSGN
ncbi:hypothetical protein V6R21_07745 [Limibacter armeniacum]|uniref:hypothetical protein n=1 Tax=Limibacter armeniacum TaxID=466084 RepID=UPI002FE56486